VRIDYLSPLPPVRSGISDYSVDLLPPLCELADVRVVRLPGQPVDPEVVERFRPVPLDELVDEPLDEASSGDARSSSRLPLYQMGNNRHHKAVLERAWEHPGVLALHDVVLHHLLLDLTLGPEGVGGDAGLALYVERLTRDHGWMGTPVARTKFWGGYGEAPTFAFPAHRTLLRRQRGVLVHSRWAAAEVERENPGVRVRAVPMGVPLPPAVEPGQGRAFRQRLGVPEAAPVIGCFGFQTPIKRTLSVVAALADPRLAEAHLLIVGEVSEALDLEAEARRAGVAERVHVTGYVSLDDFGSALAAADVAVNLRYPTAGETSASLLRILALGRPAVVSDYAQFAELPDGLVSKVPLGEGEVPALAARLSELLEDRERLAELGRAAREHVRRHHDPRSAARQVTDACREWATATPLEPLLEASSGTRSTAGGVPAGAAPAGAAPPPPTSLTWSRFPGRIQIEGDDGGLRTWRSGEHRRLRVRLVNEGPATWLAGRSGPGGVAVQVRWDTERGDLRAGRPWIPLPWAVAAGETVELEIPLRCPPSSLGPVHLVIEPHVLGGFGFSTLGGPVARRELELNRERPRETST